MRGLSGKKMNDYSKFSKVEENHCGATEETQSTRLKWICIGPVCVALVNERV